MVFPHWAVLADPEMTEEPWFYVGDQRMQGPNWWRGVLERVLPVLEHCQPSLSVGQLVTGRGMPPAAGDAGLHTGCVCLGRCQGWLDSQHEFDLQLHGRHSKNSTSLSRGYLKVKRLAFADNEKPFYLHQLLCYMYHGPPPRCKPTVHHRCHHKLCILPWHLKWSDQSENVSAGNAHRRQEDYHR